MVKNTKLHDYNDEQVSVVDYAPITELEEFDHLGVITKISVPQEGKTLSTICVHLAYWHEGDNKIHHAIAEYKKIYTNRKYQFQEFCEFFDLYENDQLDMTKAVGNICYVKFNPTYGIQLYPLNEDAREVFPYLDEVTEKFEKLEYTKEIKHLPNLLKNYWYIPDYNEYDLLHHRLFGFITDVRIIPIGIDDEKTIFTVTIFTGGKPVSYKYYINSRCDDKYESLLYMLNAVENQTANTNKTRFIPLDVWLYKARSEKIYVSNVRRARYQSEEQKKQALMLANAYKKYCININTDFGILPLEFDEC